MRELSGSSGCGKIRRSRRFGRVYVQAALLRAFGFPPPAAGADILAERDGARARRAADAREEAVVQRVVRDLERPDVVPDVGLAPVGQRVELDPSGVADLVERHVAALCRLLA